MPAVSTPLSAFAATLSRQPPSRFQFSPLSLFASAISLTPFSFSFAIAAAFDADIDTDYFIGHFAARAIDD